MKRTPGLATALLLAVFAMAAPAAVSAADPGAAPDSRHSEDAVCTKCHDESESKPILSIYQTPHGVAGDARTPSGVW